MQTKSIAPTALLAALGLVAPIAATAPAASAPPPSSSSGEAQLCFAQVPTIVGKRGEAVVGTEGPDVVVTNGSNDVQTLGGTDDICITGPDVSGTFDAGSGDDRVDSSTLGSRSFVLILLGPGSDEVTGGPGVEDVRAADATAQNPDRDAISTAGGPDSVATGGNPETNVDSIDLGDGRDNVHILDDTPQTTIRGGRGRNGLNLYLGGSSLGTWWVDNSRKRVFKDGTVFARWSGTFSRFQLQVTGPLRFTGTIKRERVEAGYPADWPIDIRTGGGHDSVSVPSYVPGTRLDGGRGRDVLATQAGTRGRRNPVLVDLAAGILKETMGSRTSTTITANFEVAGVQTNGPLTIRGTNGDNKMAGISKYYPVAIYGRAGDDQIIGDTFDDLLIGGPGFDRADGSVGTDRCEAEVELFCER